MTGSNIPAHVPEALIRDYDYFEMGDDTDVYDRFARLHDGPDIFYTPHHGGHWVVTRYADLEHILSNAEDFSSRHQTIPVTPVHVSLIESDGELHQDFRKLLQPFFTPKHIGALEKVATDLTVSLIDGFHAKGECEFTQDFALRMPIIIVMSLCELPEEDTPYLIQIAEDMVRPGDLSVQEGAFARVFQYFAEEIIPARTANPGDDMISGMIHGKIDGGRSPTDMEILTLCALMTAGGLDTVASMLGFIAMFLARNPEYRHQLIDDPARLNTAVEELMRRFHIANIARTVAHDMNYGGVDFREGDLILTATSLAGIDERHYPDAMKVDFDRADKKHLVFGRGPHQCIGSFLARTELRVFLREWLKRIPDFEIKAGEQPIVVTGKVNRVQYLLLTWDVA